MKSKSMALVLAACVMLSGCHEHIWSEATCLAPATCTECDKVEDEALADHVWLDATCTTSKTCTVCALTEGEPLPHNWVEANCGIPKTCSICNITEGKPVGEHTWTESTCEAPKTCTVCGATEGQKLRHNSTRSICTDPLTCTSCGQTVGEPKEHLWVEASCAIPKICKVCQTTEGDKLPHDFVNNTCTLCGYYVRPSVHPNAAYAKYFGIDPNIKWVENPSTRDEVINNILWNALNGDFDLGFIQNTSYNYTVNSDELRTTIDATITLYAPLLGAYNNVTQGVESGSNFRIEYDTLPLPLTEEQVFEQAIIALNEAKSISKKLHNNGTITDEMSQLEIVKAYYNYLLVNGYNENCTRGPHVEGTGGDMYYDSAYGCLINKDAACGGRAAAFMLLMNVEGIPAQGISGQIIGTTTGHGIIRVVADGTEYFVDWGNQKPIGTYTQTCEWFDFTFNNTPTLELARNAG